MKKKVETQDLLYVSLRSELDVKKDRLRAQQEIIERLQALEVSLGGTPAPAPEPAPESEPAPGADVASESEAGMDQAPEGVALEERAETAD